MASKIPEMSSAAKMTRRPQGFTLIEIVMVLAIAAIVMGGAVGMMVYSSDERILSDTSGEIELLAKRARIVAILEQTPYALEFREGVVRMLPLARAGQDERKKISGREIGGEIVDFGGVQEDYELDPGIGILVRRWNNDDWFTTTKDTVHVWRFDPDGLCEPLSVKFVINKSWAEVTFHPLTAAIRDSQFEVQ